MKKIRLLLADDHGIIRDGIKLMLNKTPEFEIITEASNGQEVLDYLKKNPKSIDVVLMDINMPIMNGIEATQVITDKYRNINVLALTMHIEETYISNMLKAGALGYILKESNKTDLIEAVKSVASGKKYYSNEVSVTLINSLMTGSQNKDKELSERELEVLTYIASGNTNNEIGEKLFISGRTVETHRRNILSKLDVKNTAEMIKYAIKNNLVM
jgi:DNA-binding NarL/FixJ family response regulator